MHIITNSYNPKLSQFFLSLVVMLLVYTTVGFIFYFAAHILGDASFYSYLTGNWPVIAFFPVITSVFHAYASRKHQLSISGVRNPEEAALWTTRFFRNEGMQIKSSHDNKFVLESNKKYNRALGHWFGTELVEVTYTDHEVITSGHYKYTDALDTKLRFGKVMFK
jgi:hypothetical protein